MKVKDVLILVLLELILLHEANAWEIESLMRCFNPCFIGTYSFTGKLQRSKFWHVWVLILVLLELILLLVTPKHIEITSL